MSHLEVGVYKLDNNGESFVSNCFPISSFYHQSKEGAGHWQLAPRSSVEDRCSIQQKILTPASVHSPHTTTQRKPKIPGNTLNRQLLMSLHCVDKPSDLCSVDISERRLHWVELEGLEEFDSVAYINASDNCVTLDSFSRFPALRELELSLNGICTMDFCAENFPRLEVLDLSYNNLSSETILTVGLLPRLKVLHLTGNDLLMLPPNMAGPYRLHEGAVEARSLFQTLEVLMLDDNKLFSPGVFDSLANLKRLQHLNLQGNDITEVPYLQPKLLPPSHQQTEVTIMTQSSDSPVDQREFIAEEQEALAGSKDECPPFPQLQYLNLAGNEIVDEEALLAVALFPVLSELIIHSNPLTTQRRGDPSVLTSFLQDRLGIKIIRKKTPHIVKPKLLLHVNHKRKVKTKIPKVPKVPLITEATCTSDSSCTDRGHKNSSRLPSMSSLTDALLPCWPQSSAEEREEDSAAARRSDLLQGEDSQVSSETHQTNSPFFVTEINEILEPEYQDINKETETPEVAHCVKQNPKECPKHLIGYEVLLDDNLDLDMYEPVGIQQTVKALEHTLKNLLVYRDSKASLDHFQRPYRGQKKRIVDLPPVKPWKPKGEKVKEILTEMKERKTITEVPLNKVLQNKDMYRREYDEALTLLRDMKMKYKMVHMKAMEQAAQMENISQ